MDHLRDSYEFTTILYDNDKIATTYLNSEKCYEIFYKIRCNLVSINEIQLYLKLANEEHDHMVQSFLIRLYYFGTIHTPKCKVKVSYYAKQCIEWLKTMVILTNDKYIQGMIGKLYICAYIWI